MSLAKFIQRRITPHCVPPDDREIAEQNDHQRDLFSRQVTAIKKSQVVRQVRLVAFGILLSLAWQLCLHNTSAVITPFYGNGGLVIDFDFDTAVFGAAFGRLI